MNLATIATFKFTRDGQRLSVADTRYPLADIRQCQGIADLALDVRFPQKFGQVSGYPKGYPPPEGEMAGWKGVLPVDGVLVPRRLEGSPSRRSVAGPLEGGYPRIPAAANGYPPAGAGADADAWMAGKSSRISGC
jgi:hypothetical protein